MPASRVLVIGGYGGFGARLSKRLAAAGHSVLVAGRNRIKAERFCAGLPGATPVAADRNYDVASLLDELRPDLVIDAAGPFQGASYAVPRACSAAGIHYLDLADARDFVCGIDELDLEARKAGVAVISGASSVPALSGAVVRRLSQDMDRVSQVEIAISASTRSTASRSVTGAILSYAGRPVRLWRGGRWTSAIGGSELRRMKFEIAGAMPLRRRWLALCDVPDLAILPELLPGNPAVTFRAGSDRPPQILGLWLVSWLVRLGMVRSLKGLAGLFVWLQRAVLWVGSDRSAMRVMVRGWRDGERVERDWTLIAENGSGPEVPTLAAALLADAIRSGRLPPGAHDASASIELYEFERLLDGLPVIRGVGERVLEPTLYRRAIGNFDELPPLVRRIHEVNGDAGAAGEGKVSRGPGILASLLCRLMRLPPSGSYPLHVSFAELCGAERWTRHFGGHRFSSVLRHIRHGVQERFGPISFDFELPSNREGLGMVLRGWSFLRVPLPLALAPRIQAREWQEGNRFRFHVDVAMALVGPLIRYSGWLVPIGAERKRAAGKARPPLNVARSVA